MNNTSLRFPQDAPGSSTYSYTTTNAFGLLGFQNPIALAVPPGETNRLFVVQRAGIIAVVTNMASPNSTVFMNITNRIGGLGDEGGLLALAFHPGYATNRTFFVYYTAPSGTQLLDRISRFTTLTNNPNGGDSNSEAYLISQFDQAGTHNGGDLHFGADGYLYASLGDEGNGNDVYNNSQVITGDFFSCMLRLDVDKLPGSLPPNPHAAIDGATTNYAIPPDNPFVGATQFNGNAILDANTIRTEFFAVGFRNPFRFSIDPVNGDILLGDVGQTNREEISLVVSGGNYGWAFREGLIPANAGTNGGISGKIAPAAYNPTSLLANASFELGNGSTTISNWIRAAGTETREGGEATNGYSLQALTFPHGTNALRVSGNDSDLYQTNLPVLAGSNYLARGFFYHSPSEDPIAGTSTSTRAYMVVEWFTAANAPISSSTSTAHSGATLANSWWQINLSLTAPTNADHATFHIRSDCDDCAGGVFADKFYFGTTPATDLYKEPLLDYGRGIAGTNTGLAVTGGIVYRGDNFPELYGRYIFTDYLSGNIWAMTHDGFTAQTFGRLLGLNNVAYFLHDPRNNEFLMANLGGTVRRLVYSSVSTNFPQTLADTGAFSNLLTLA
ncbi:MAG TPA: PQQ-dependent sugar dehydrogenase, partial [Kiritimatiellia bacterium]